MSAQSQGVFSALLIEPGASAHTFDASSERYEFLAENMAKHGRIVGARGIRGTRSAPSERTRAGAYYVYGSVTMDISPADFTNLLPHILGAAESSDTFALAEDTPYFGMLIDRVGDVFEYSDCKVNRAILRGRAPRFNEEGSVDLLNLTLEIIGTDEDKTTAWPGTPPSLGTDANDAPYVFSDSDGGVTILSGTREIEDFVIVVDNHQYARFVNSLTPDSICPTDRTVMARFRVPYNSTNHSALYDQAVAGSTASVVFTNNNMSTTFTFGTLQIPTLSPSVRGKQDVSLYLDGIARTVTTTKELVVTNDDNDAS